MCVYVIKLQSNRLPYLSYTCINSEKLLNKSVFSIFEELIYHHVIFFLIFFQYFGMMRQLNLKRSSQKKKKKLILFCHLIKSNRFFKLDQRILQYNRSKRPYCMLLVLLNICFGTVWYNKLFSLLFILKFL